MDKLLNPDFASVDKWEAGHVQPGYGAAVRKLMLGLDRVSLALAVVAMVCAVLLTGVMCWEVVVRRLFNSPTLWAYDVTYMLNGTLVFLGGAYTLIKNEHVRIDFLSSKLPRPVQDLINVAFYVFLFLPILGALAYTSAAEAWRAYASGAVEAASTWGPLSWPFYATLAIGIVSLFMQCVVQMLRHAMAAAGHGRSPLERADAEGLPG